MTVEAVKIAHKLKINISDLITRPVGKKFYNAAVKMLNVAGKDEVAVVDFTGIGVIDPSFADEFLVKLADYSRERGFYLRVKNISRSAESNIRSVFDSYREFAKINYALAVEDTLSDKSHVIGGISEDGREIINFLNINKSSKVESIASGIGKSIGETAAELTKLLEIRLIRTDDKNQGYYFSVL
jgi:hypothetical protein